MQHSELPPKPEKTTSELVAQVLAGNFMVLLALGAVGGVGIMLALPVLNIIAGVVLLFTTRRKLGKVMLLSGLVVGLLGLGTCALILSNLRISH